MVRLRLAGPGGMYLLAVLWVWTIVLGPAVSGLTAMTFQLVDASMLLALTGAYLGLYMGGNPPPGGRGWRGRGRDIVEAARELR
ncbi:hypothetical protein IGS74_10745 [Aureimonas sp. OT7]|uniref:hypothetical protein n=1 Tax=Aureimonas sp. OT7 TaxID=2816454 RepID=UPI0017830327|nr:hypothetical protein [Aureimonas sp. OT7]QOG05131.1 hypothetical protein IGS74_10745 [Aureimonas sp. OT7]